MRDGRVGYLQNVNTSHRCLRGLGGAITVGGVCSRLLQTGKSNRITDQNNGRGRAYAPVHYYVYYLIILCTYIYTGAVQGRIVQHRCTTAQGRRTRLMRKTVRVYKSVKLPYN